MKPKIRLPLFMLVLLGLFLLGWLMLLGTTFVPGEPHPAFSPVPAPAARGMIIPDEPGGKVAVKWADQG